METFDTDKNWHAILADDDDDDCFIFNLAIDELQIDVFLTRAKDGDMLLKMLAAKTPDILFLDLILPRKSGIECLKEIRRNSAYDSLAVIIISSVQLPSSIKMCHEGGASGFVCKDVSLEGLKSKLRRVFNTNWLSNHLAPSFEDFVINN